MRLVLVLILLPLVLCDSDSSTISPIVNENTSSVSNHFAKQFKNVGKNIVFLCFYHFDCKYSNGFNRKK